MSVNIDEVVKLMRDTENIRNVGFAGHIDHGKTTTIDCLLAYCNVIAPFLAGQVRYLDYLDMEQKRGITIKSSVISIPVKIGNKQKYLLNLIDTPGHVDFSGKVSRALRLMDGVIIVVDAVEGIMAQTEAYLKLSLEEHVRPLLYINKIDRLIAELSLNIHQIQNRLEEIIFGFNDLIEVFGEKYQRKSWKVNPARDSVIFGSALNCWGFSLSKIMELNMKFKDIIKIFKEDPKRLRATLPLGETLALTIFKNVPNPKKAQSYRLKYLWTSDKLPKEIELCSTNGSTVFYVSKCTLESGKILAIGRVFSGVLRVGEYICLNTGDTRRVDAVRLMLGSKSKFVNAIYSGNVFGAFIKARAGETFSNKLIKGHFRVPKYVAVPVVFVAIEPKSTQDFDKLLKELEIYSIEDPNMFFEINKETGEILLGGIGELHLEIILNDLIKKIDIYSTEPMVAYRELIIGQTKIDQNNLLIEIEGIKDLELLRKAIFGEIEDSENGNIIQLKNFNQEEKDAIKSIIKSALKNGPLIGEPVIGCKLQVIKRNAKEKTDMNALLAVLSRALASLKTELAEPYYEFEISTKPDYVGSIISEINRRGGKIKKLEGGEGDYVKVRGMIPVRTSLGLPSDIRALAHGRAYIQLNFYNYLVADEKAKERIINDIKLRKGLE